MWRWIVGLVLAAGLIVSALPALRAQWRAGRSRWAQRRRGPRLRDRQNPAGDRPITRREAAALFWLIHNYNRHVPQDHDSLP